MADHRCSAPGCDRVADVEVRLYDLSISLFKIEVFDKRDFTCPFLCARHARENEVNAQGERKPRGMVSYPYSNRDHAPGFTIYQSLVKATSSA